MITADRAKQMIDYNKETGNFYWKVSRGGIKKGLSAGNLMKDGYLVIKIDGKTYKGHRLAWLISNNQWPMFDIDHINGNKSDNRLQNLRDVTTSVNMQNQRCCHKNNVSGYLGVTRLGDKWRARIRVNKKEIYLGIFDDAEKAHSVYLDFKRKLHEGSQK